MSWALGSWKRQIDTFHLTLGYGQIEPTTKCPPIFLKNGLPLKAGDLKLPCGGAQDLASGCRFRVQVDWSAGDDEDQVVLKLQSQLMVTLPAPHDQVKVELSVIDGSNSNRSSAEEPDQFEVEECGDDGPAGCFRVVAVSLRVFKRRESLRVVSMSRTAGSGVASDGLGVVARILDPSSLEKSSHGSVTEELLGSTQNWRSVTVLNLSGCSLSVLPAELVHLPMLQKLCLDNNKLTMLPPELGQLTHLEVLRVDQNLLISVPAELRECVGLVELSLEQNKLVRPLLDFRAMVELRILRLFGNPIEFLPEILPCTKLRYLSLANVRIEGDEALTTVGVDIEAESASYFAASKHKLSAFFSLIFRFSSCQHPLLASALAKIAQDNSNRAAIGKDESAVRQLLSMMLSENRHVVEQACLALSSLAADASLVLRLMRGDVIQAIELVLKSAIPELLISVLQVIANLAFTSDRVASKMLTKEIFRRLKLLCAHNHSEVQRRALLAVGNLAFCWENRRQLVASESLRELLLRLSAGSDGRSCKAAARVLAILGENEYLRRAIKARPVPKRGLRILSMDGGGMRGLATVQMLRRIEAGTGKKIHELFDLICGTSTGGMLSVALGIKHLSLDQCEEIYKNLGKLVFAVPVPKDNEAATWREKIDQLYKSSSQSFRVVVHGSKHNADEFERLLRELCTDEEGDLLIESAVKGVPKVFVVATLVSVTPAQPFVFRNYQYPPGTPEISSWTAEGPVGSVSGTPPTASSLTSQVGRRRSAFIGSCKHQVWEAIRASSAAPYYLDDFACDTSRWQDGAIVANNPAIISIREAQLLWPDIPVACLVSIGCGNLPMKTRGKGGWRYLDTGQVLIESACSVERAEEALDTLLTLIPDIQYFRFNPVDDRCGMELDETDPAEWVKLESATQEYVEANSKAFDAVCNILVPPVSEDQSLPDRLRSSLGVLSNGRGQSLEETGLGVGWRRRILLVESVGCPKIGKPFGHIRYLETFCSRQNIKLELFNCVPATTRKVPDPVRTPFTSPPFTSVSPHMFSPDVGLHPLSRPEVVPLLSLDGSAVGKASFSPPGSPPLGSHQFSGPVLALHENLLSSPQVGIVHLALYSDFEGLVLSWKTDIIAIAEPGEISEGFLQSVVTSIRQSTAGQVRKRATPIPNFSTLSNLVANYPSFMLAGALHRFTGRHTQVLADGREAGAYLFERTRPAAYLSAEDVKWMVGDWRGRIVICSGPVGPSKALVKAFLDSGAKAVIASSVEPTEPRANGEIVPGEGDSVDPDFGRFVIEDEDENNVPGSPDSDWEDSEEDREEHVRDREESEEKTLAAFLGVLYDALFREGVAAEVALQRALSVQPNQPFACHMNTR